MPTLKELILEKEKLNQQAREILVARKVELDPLEEALNAVEKQIEAKVVEIGKQKLAENKKDTGTVNFPLEGVMVKAQVSKTVKWNQEGLAGLFERIRTAGDNPSEYMKITFDVSETKFKEWPDAVKNAFSPFRTVVPGKPRFDYTIIEEAVPATDTPPWQ